MVEKSPSDLPKRALVGILLIAVALGAVFAPNSWPFAVLVAVGVLLVYAEWAVMHRITRVWRLVGLAVIGIAVLAAQVGLYYDALAGLAIAAVVLGILAKLTGGHMRWSTPGILYAGLPAIALVWLRAQPGGPGFVIWVLAVVWATDIGAYFAGRRFGGPKLAPAISPKKTWSGLIGGMVAAAIVSAGIAYAQNWHPALWLAVFAALGAAAAVLAQVGDLFESWLKRRVGVKDSGTLLPGHGGLMDRVDGLIPVAIAAALVLRALM